MDSLDPTILICGVTCLAFFVIWLLGMRVESMSDAFHSLPAAGVAMGALLISPFFFYYAWQQIGAKTRLAQEQLPVCAAFGHAVGAQGGRAPRGIWRFEARDAASNIFSYYETAAAKAGWKVEKKKNGLLLTKAGISLALWSEIYEGKEQVIIQKQASSAR